MRFDRKVVALLLYQLSAGTAFYVRKGTPSNLDYNKFLGDSDEKPKAPKTEPTAEVNPQTQVPPRGMPSAGGMPPPSLIKPPTPSAGGMPPPSIIEPNVIETKTVSATPQTVYMQAPQDDSEPIAPRTYSPKPNSSPAPDIETSPPSEKSIIFQQPASNTPTVLSGGGGKSKTYTHSPDRKLTKRGIWETADPITVQGNSLRTFTFSSTEFNRLQFALRTDGRPLNADIELWQGPDFTPQKIRVFLEDGNAAPFTAIVETAGGTNTLGIRNIGPLEFPLDAFVHGDTENLLDEGITLKDIPVARNTLQGGSTRLFPFSYQVSSVQILLKTDGRPLTAKIELLQGPNNAKQEIQVYTEDGLQRPFYAVLETPGNEKTVRVVNTGTVEFPLTVSVQPMIVDTFEPSTEALVCPPPKWEKRGTGFFFSS